MMSVSSMTLDGPLSNARQYASGYASSVARMEMAAEIETERSNRRWKLALARKLR